MATQGLLTVLDEAGHVVIKVVCGCDGRDLAGLAEKLRRRPTRNLGEIRSLAAASGAGCDACLVVMDAHNILAEDVRLISPLYRETFDQARFNPRWALGLVDQYFELVIPADPTTNT